MKKYLTLKNLGWLFTAMVVFMLGKSGVSKIMATEEMVNNFAYIKLSPYLGLVGLLEIIGVIALAIPRTSIYGAILISCIMSSAVTVHLSYMSGQNVIIPVLIGIWAWTGHCLRKYPTCCQTKKN
jgi:uncharacterized membrane protein YphA (DoxX/SURF4 family)